jgi:hypothetical protein
MELKTLLAQKRKAILDRWLSKILKTYPADAVGFMSRNTNRFGNPVRYTLSHEIEILFNALVGDVQAGSVNAALEQINKIRAVQDFTPSQAVAYVFLLKTAIREELNGELNGNGVIEDMLSLESRIDGLALMAFDSYMRCREKLFEVKCNDIRRRASWVGVLDKESSTDRS